MTKNAPPSQALCLEMHNYYTKVVKSPKLAEEWLKAHENYDQYIKNWNEEYANRNSIAHKPT
jgi:hypothetical protein